MSRLVALLLLVLAAPAHAAGVAGGIVHARGAVVVTDSPFDDHGADTVDNRDPGEDIPNSQAPGANAGQGNVGEATGGPEGDDDYPPGDAYLRNAADIVETRLAASRRSWSVRVRLNTVVDPAVPWVEARVAGHVLLIHAGGATFDGRAVRGGVDARRDVASARIPRALYDPGHAVRDVFVAAGIERGRYFDLAYVPHEGFDSYWRDKAQSADIAAGDFSRDAIPVDFGALRRSPRVPDQGFLTRVFRSRQRLGDGVVPQTRFDADAGTYPPNLYRSRYQPYAVYRPRHPTGATVVLLHFLGGNYMSYLLTAREGIAAWAEHLGVTVLMPEARGEGGWYQGEAEKDVFEVLRDAAAHYRVDRERVYLAGMSMGGFGTWRLTQLYPDVFARGIVWAGPTVPNAVWPYPGPPTGPSCGPEEGDCAYDLADLFGNTRNVPLLVVHGGTDDLVPATGAEHWMERYAAVGGGTFRYLLYPGRTHETSFPGTTGPWVEQWLRGLPRRVRHPARVTYTVQRNLDQPRFGIHYRGAYWVHGLALAPGVPRGRIDARRSVGEDAVKPVGPSFATDALGPYRLSGQDVTPAPLTSHRLEVVATGLRRAVITVLGAGKQRVRGSTDRALTLVLRRRGRTRRVLRLAPGAFDRTV